MSPGLGGDNYGIPEGHPTLPGLFKEVWVQDQPDRQVASR